MKINPFSPRTRVGIDVQPGVLRIVQLHRQQLVCAESIALPENVFVDGRIRRYDLLQQILAEQVQRLQINGLAAIALPINLARMQRMQVPNGLAHASISAEIDAVVQRDLPGMRDALCIDYSLLPSRETGYTDVVFTAARKEHVFAYVACVVAAGLQVKVVDLDLYALKRAVQQASQMTLLQGQVHAVLHVIHHRLVLLVFNQAEIIFHQPLTLTDGLDLAAQLQRLLQLFASTCKQAELTNITLCCVAADQDKYLQLITQQHLQPHTVAIFAANDTRSTAEYLLAYGLALREMPHGHY